MRMSNSNTYLKSRIQVLLTEEELERCRGHASAAGLSLSAWFREAGMERVRRADNEARLTGPQQLDAFFGECDVREADKGAEPDWEEHMQVILRSLERGQSGT